MNRSAEVVHPRDGASDRLMSRTVASLRMTNGRVSIVRWSTGLAEQLVCAGDLVLLMVAIVPAALLVRPTPAFPTAFHEGAVAAGMAVAAGYLLRRLRSYSLHRLCKVAHPALDVIASVACPVILVDGAMLLLTRPSVADHRLVLFWGGFALAGLLVARQAERWLVGAGLRQGALRRKVVMIGATPLAEHLIRQLQAQDSVQPSRVVGIYDDRNAIRRPAVVAGIPVEGDVDALCAFAGDNPVDLIVIALPWQRAMEIFRLIQRVQWISADVMIPMEEGTFNPRTASVSSVAGQPALQVARQPLQGARSLLKLVEDYAVAAVAVVVLAPLMLLCAAAIKLDSPGPVLFRQTRVGLNNRSFKCIKFRTMRPDASDLGTVGTTKHNPRITRVGAILRRLSLDEVPQLINVLRGEMSIVGPRPHVPGMMVGGEEYADAVREYAARHRIKPGITGLAQVNGMRGGIHSVQKARRGVELDMAYVEKWSLGLDIRIMARTLLVGMFGSKVF